jgi:hypothetical protein
MIRLSETRLPGLFKVGVGVAVLVGIALTVFIGVKYFIPKHPTDADLLGKWQSEGKSHKDTRTYTGIYDFYAIGRHTYDIIVSDGVHKQGRGVWSLPEGSDTLQVENDTGSVYVGAFQRENFTKISLTTTNRQWGVVLKKQEGASTLSAAK